MEKSEIRLKSEILHSCILITHLWRIPLLWTADFIQKKKSYGPFILYSPQINNLPFNFLTFSPRKNTFLKKKMAYVIKNYMSIQFK